MNASKIMSLPFLAEMNHRRGVFFLTEKMELQCPGFLGGFWKSGFWRDVGIRCISSSLSSWQCGRWSWSPAKLLISWACQVGAFCRGAQKGEGFHHPPQHAFRLRVCIWSWILRCPQAGNLGDVSRHLWISRAFWFKSQLVWMSVREAHGIFSRKESDSYRLWGLADNTCAGTPMF